MKKLPAVGRCAKNESMARLDYLRHKKRSNKNTNTADKSNKTRTYINYNNKIDHTVIAKWESK